MKDRPGLLLISISALAVMFKAAAQLLKVRTEENQLAQGKESELQTEPMPTHSNSNADEGGGTVLDSKTSGVVPVEVFTQKNLPIEIFTQDRVWHIIGYLGPTLTGLGSLIIAAVVFYYGNKLNQLQVQIQERQTALATRQTEIDEAQKRAAISDMLSKFFTDLTDPNESKKTFAAIGLAAHGKDALPVVKIALGVEQSLIRGSAVEVVVLLFQSGTVDRKYLFEELMSYLNSPNLQLRTGVLECFFRMGDQLNEHEEGQKIIQYLKEKVSPHARCGYGDEQVLLGAAKLLSNWPRLESKDYLLGIAQTFRCKRSAWFQALESLPEVTRPLTPDERKAIVKHLEGLRPTLLKEALNASLQDRGNETQEEFARNVRTAIEGAIKSIKEQ